MPVYEFECAACGGRFEVMRKFSDPVLTACRLCNSSDIRKMLSPTSFVLKGTGWYATDYPSKEQTAGAKTDKPSTEPSATSGCSSGACASGKCPSKS